SEAAPRPVMICALTDQQQYEVRRHHYDYYTKRTVPMYPVCNNFSSPYLHKFPRNNRLEVSDILEA
ncbi:MAG: hypothetical protein J3T61_12585, partial [Candidatus Brocadiales bacterium]|nr:hypothetical protein [Candidatus Bathyanammoxibius sp.]